MKTEAEDYILAILGIDYEAYVKEHMYNPVIPRLMRLLKELIEKNTYLQKQISDPKSGFIYYSESCPVVQKKKVWEAFTKFVDMNQKYDTVADEDDLTDEAYTYFIKQLGLEKYNNSEH